jgi:hypothetical protein
MDKNIKLQVHEKTELSVEQVQEIKSKFLGNLKPHNGHRVFEINIIEGTIEKASYYKDDKLDWLDIKRKINRRILVKQDCIYISALNEINAVKKYLYGRNGSK